MNIDVNSNKLEDLIPVLSVPQKAQILDVLLSGGANGMSIFWEIFDKLQGYSQRDILAQMYKLAVVEAMEVVFEEVES